jgi:serine/threonine-protein kinase
VAREEIRNALSRSAEGEGMKAESGVEYTVGEPMPGTRWVVRGKLGQGGMGVVLDVEKDRAIRGAMKVLLPRFARVPEYAARFLEEVRVTARLQHVNIVQVLDSDRLADATPFMVMERLRGRTLGAAMREARQQGRRWTAGNTFAVASQVAEGLYRAHANVPSIVHRDIKPENIYLHRPEGSHQATVKVMDFGVAALVGAKDAKVVGTPRYMAPEQLEGARLSSQTDQYAFALVVYEMLTDRLPWDVSGAKALAKARLKVPPASAVGFCPWLPEEVDRALRKALSRDPAKRYESVHALMFELRRLEWIADHTTGSGDYYPTVPTVGTLAEGPPFAFGGPDTVGRMTPPPVEGPSLQLFEAVSLLDRSWQQPTQHDPEPSTAATGSTTDDESPTRVATTRPPTIPIYEDLEPDARGPRVAPAPEAPLNSDATRGDGRRSSRRGMRRLAFPLATAAAAAALGSLGAKAFSAKARAEIVAPSSSVAASTPPGQGALEAMAVGQQASEEPTVAGTPLPEWLASASEAASARAAAAPHDAGASVVRKPISAAPRPHVRAVLAATPVPDDGRDELYLPEAPKPISAAPRPPPRPAASVTRVRDDGYDELYVPGTR